MQLIFLQICLIICFFKYFFLLHYFSFRFSHVNKEVYRAICFYLLCFSFLLFLLQHSTCLQQLLFFNIFTKYKNMKKKISLILLMKKKYLEFL